MKILVTGSTGFLGRHVVAGLLGNGHEVVAVARDGGRVQEMPWRAAVDFIACDLHAPNAVACLPRDVDAVMHLAWPGLPNYKALFHFEETLPAECRFLKALVLSGVERLLVTGTCFEYGLLCGAVSEEAVTAPVTPYAQAKDSLRRYLQTLQQEYPFRLQWARMFYMYGEGQHPNSLLPQLDQSIDRGDAVFNMSGGEQLRDYLPVDQVAACLVNLIERVDFDGIVNVCSGTPISIRRLVEERIARRNASIKLNLGHYPYLDYEPMAFWGDDRKLKRVLRSAGKP